ncbi:ATP-binding protein [bacterium]|nr:ATP-binding protein [bacterium]
MKRLQEDPLRRDLERKYVFLAGPRQAGKTTLARQLLGADEGQYLNYDRAEDRQIITAGEWSRDRKIVVLDEVHKFPKWKSFLKGYFDTEGIPPALLVTGSARLNVCRQGNDSMVGRYYSHRLLPLSVRELLAVNGVRGKPDEILSDLLRFGNFPEPFLLRSEKESRRWQQQYVERVVREDVTDLSLVRSIQKITLLVDLLRQRVGSTVSYAALARDLEVASSTVKSWIEILEQLFLIFRVTPYHQNISRSLLKEPKIYFFDATAAFDEKAHLENLVAVSLLKHLWYQEDIEGIPGRLHYLRVKDGKEVDFLLVENNIPTEMIEVKHSDTTLHGGLQHFHKFLREAKRFQLVRDIRQEKTVEDVQISSVSRYLAHLAA